MRSLGDGSPPPVGPGQNPGRDLGDSHPEAEAKWYIQILKFPVQKSIFNRGGAELTAVNWAHCACVS